MAVIQVFIAKEDVVVQRNLQAQVGMAKVFKPGLLTLTMWYKRAMLHAENLEDAFAEAQDNPTLLRSAMVGDVFKWGDKYYVALPVGFEEFNPPD